MAARNELIKMSLTERQPAYHIDGYLCAPYTIGIAMIVLLIAAAFVFSAAFLSLGLCLVLGLQFVRGGCSEV